MARDVVIARRYAQALFLAAKRKDAVAQVGADLALVLVIDTGQGGRIRHFLEAPQVLVEQKLAVLEAGFRSHVHGLVVEFLKLLLRKKRLFHLRDIVEQFERLVEDHQGIVRARVTTAVPLEDAETKALVRSLEASLAKKVNAVTLVDPSILGGMVVKVGDRIADRSVARMLEIMREQLLAAPVVS
jgi:F-type H+-transporting ATPase subunit delta